MRNKQASLNCFAHPFEADCCFHQLAQRPFPSWCKKARYCVKAWFFSETITTSLGCTNVVPYYVSTHCPIL